MYIASVPWQLEQADVWPLSLLPPLFWWRNKWKAAYHWRLGRYHLLDCQIESLPVISTSVCIATHMDSSPQHGENIHTQGIAWSNSKATQSRPTIKKNRRPFSERRLRSLKNKVMAKLNKEHLRISKMKLMAHSYVWWRLRISYRIYYIIYIYPIGNSQSMQGIPAPVACMAELTMSENFYRFHWSFPKEDLLDHPF